MAPRVLQYILGPGATWTDAARAVLDVAVLGYLFYRVLLLIRGTRAIRVLAGLFLLSFAYLAAQWANLVTLSWFLGSFVSYTLVFGMIVLFQTDIRRGLAHLGRGGGLLAGLAGAERRAHSGTVEVVARAAAELSRCRRGALIVVERLGDLEELADTGVELDAVLSPELLLSIFHTGGALHDGAVIVRRGRVIAARCLLPLTTTATARELGTRHRAALGLVEEIDALVVVVSEERGEISLGVDGALRRGLDEDGLRRLLALQLVPAEPLRGGPGERRGWARARSSGAGRPDPRFARAEGGPKPGAAGEGTGA